jgi:CheY-like chemotaxis protein
VETARTAGAALSLDLEKVSMLISDIGLPDLDGRELLRRLRAKGDVKAIALSGYGTEADMRASEEAGFLRHLTKPVEFEDLLGAIEQALAAELPTANGREPSHGFGTWSLARPRYMCLSLADASAA